MAKKSNKNNAANKAISKESRSMGIAQKGITTGHDFANFMSALMSDLISGAVAPNVGNAACNAGGKLLKAVEMQMKYGTNNEKGQKVLTLALQAPLVEQVQ